MMRTDLDPRSVLVGMLTGALATVAALVCLFLGLRRLGLSWTGEVFGGGPFNWKDSFVYLCAAAVYLMAMIPTTRYVIRRRTCGDAQRPTSQQEENGTGRDGR